MHLQNVRMSRQPKIADAGLDDEKQKIIISSLTSKIQKWPIRIIFKQKPLSSMDDNAVTHSTHFVTSAIFITWSSYFQRHWVNFFLEIMSESLTIWTKSSLRWVGSESRVIVHSKTCHLSWLVIPFFLQETWELIVLTSGRWHFVRQWPSPIFWSKTPSLVQRPRSGYKWETDSLLLRQNLAESELLWITHPRPRE